MEKALRSNMNFPLFPSNGKVVLEMRPAQLQALEGEPGGAGGEPRKRSTDRHALNQRMEQGDADSDL